MEANRISTDRPMGKKNMVYMYSGILFSLKQEGNSDTCYNMDEPWSEWNKSDTKGQCIMSLILGT